MEKQKRERSSNFSAEETNLLISLIEMKKSIIENKKSDATTWQEKEKAWKDIEKVFNSASGTVFRDHKHLKIKYEAMKKDTKKKSAMARAGGETCTAPPRTTMQEKVKSMTRLSVEGNESQFDSDLILPSKPKEKRLLDRLTEEKLEIAKIQRKLVTEELEQKRIERRLLEQELDHKENIYELERQHLLLKIKLLKKELGDN